MLLAPPIEQAHQVDGLPLGVRVAAVQLVERVGDNQRVTVREQPVERRDLGGLAVQPQPIGRAHNVDGVAVGKPRLAQPALDRLLALLGPKRGVESLGKANGALFAQVDITAVLAH